MYVTSRKNFVISYNNWQYYTVSRNKIKGIYRKKGFDFAQPDIGKT